MSSPTVSIIIPAYNARQFITRAIDSCLAQTYTDYEVIVVDDGSTDGTGDLVRERYGDQVQVVRKENGGVATARNAGIDTSNSEYIKPLDADDTIHPTYLERVMQRFDEVDEQVAMVYTRFYFVEGDSRTPKSQPVIEGDMYCHLIKTAQINKIVPSTVMIKRKQLIEVGKFPDERELQYIEDWDTWVRLAEKYHIAGINECLVDYHWHGGNMSDKTIHTSEALLLSFIQANKRGKWHDCITQHEMNNYTAGLHHKVAMKHWEYGNRSKTRTNLQKALALSPQGKIMRRILYALSYIAPFGVAFIIDRVLDRIRNRRK